jgi:CRP/FNR family transcriptional regulator, cyclic AMP receptor protein
MLSADHRTTILSAVPLFAQVPAACLGHIAEVLEEVRVAAGEAVFEYGDEGDCMYIVVDGRVRVHRQELTIAMKSRLDVFGEMAVLDPERRSAAATAMEDTTLFRLDRAALAYLMDTQPEIVRGVIRVLCQYVRTNMQNRTMDFDYLRQVARVTAAAAVEAGMYDAASLNAVAERDDELGQLARVFQRMAREVYVREEQLRRQLDLLRIEIDEGKKGREVAEITETETFNSVLERVRRFRARRQNP